MEAGLGMMLPEAYLRQDPDLPSRSAGLQHGAFGGNGGGLEIFGFVHTNDPIPRLRWVPGFPAFLP